ncbi:MAG: hypothetical protein HYY52_05660 [Candidatus Melainabacteria bacterium]|nr:hypothetical protein [Candidatus Melainabacteria bacterium]
MDPPATTTPSIQQRIEKIQQLLKTDLSIGILDRSGKVVGKKDGLLTTEELKAALSIGHLSNFNQILITKDEFSSKQNLYFDYIRHLGESSLSNEQKKNVLELLNLSKDGKLIEDSSTGSTTPKPAPPSDTRPSPPKPEIIVRLEKTDTPRDLLAHINRYKKETPHEEDSNVISLGTYKVKDREGKTLQTVTAWIVDRKDIHYIVGDENFSSKKENRQIIIPLAKAKQTIEYFGSTDPDKKIKIALWGTREFEDLAVNSSEQDKVKNVIFLSPTGRSYRPPGSEVEFKNGHQRFTELLYKTYVASDDQEQLAQDGAKFIESTTYEDLYRKSTDSSYRPESISQVKIEKNNPVVNDYLKGYPKSSTTNIPPNRRPPFINEDEYRITLSTFKTSEGTPSETLCCESLIWKKDAAGNYQAYSITFTKDKFLDELEKAKIIDKDEKSKLKSNDNDDTTEKLRKLFIEHVVFIKATTDPNQDILEAFKIQEKRSRKVIFAGDLADLKSGYIREIQGKDGEELRSSFDSALSRKKRKDLDKEFVGSIKLPENIYETTTDEKKLEEKIGSVLGKSLPAFNHNNLRVKVYYRDDWCTILIAVLDTNNKPSHFKEYVVKTDCLLKDISETLKVDLKAPDESKINDENIKDENNPDNKTALRLLDCIKILIAHRKEKGETDELKLFAGRPHVYPLPTESLNRAASYSWAYLVKDSIERLVPTKKDQDDQEQHELLHPTQKFDRNTLVAAGVPQNEHNKYLNIPISVNDRRFDPKEK